MAALLVRMYPVSVKQRGMIPEQVKIVNKTPVVSPSGRLEPGVKAEESDEMASSVTKSGDGLDMKTGFSQFFKTSKRRLKSFLE